MYRSPARVSLRRRIIIGIPLAAAALTAALVSPSSPATAASGPAPRAAAASTNPLANRTWGNYTSKYDALYDYYAHSTGAKRALLARIALQPHMRWFGSWTADSDIKSQMQEYIKTVTKGNPSVLVQMAIFRLNPWEGAACRQLPTAAQQASYKRWINNAAAGIGSAHVAMVLQPDLPFAFCVPKHSLIPLGLVSYAASKFSSLPHTSVYIDAGAQDWKSVANDAWMLRMAGVAHARGFALDATHFDGLPSEIRYGGAVNAQLAKAGITGRKFVINTDQNGRPFKAGQVSTARFNDMTPCTKASQRFCSAVGVSPTWHVANSSFGLPAWAASLALRECDAYLWFGRPWLKPPSVFRGDYAMSLARSTYWR
jgi:endoglucanase